MDDKKKKLDELAKKMEETRKSWKKNKTSDLKERPKEVVKESISKKKDVSEKEIKQSTITKKGNSYYDKDGRLVVKNTEGTYVPYESAVKQVELKQDNRSEQTKKTVKEYDEAIKNPGTLDKLAFFGEQPLNYLEDPTKIIGDLGFNGFPTSKENFESFVKEINNPYKKESSIERALDRTVPKIPAAAFNYALANIGARTPAQALAEAYNPIPGFDVKSTFGKTRNAITSPSIARISGNNFDIDMPLNGKNINGIDDASEIYKSANNSKSITEKGKDFLKNSYNKIATGDSPIPFAWKSPAVGLTQDESYKIMNKIKGGENLSEAEKVLLGEYQYDSNPFTGRRNRLNEDKRQSFNNLIETNPSVFTEDTVLTRRFNPENKELFDMKSGKVNFGQRPTSFSAGIGTENFGSNAIDRFVLSGKNAKKVEQKFLKNNYKEISDDTYNNIQNFTTLDDPNFTGKPKVFPDGNTVKPLWDGFVKNLDKAKVEKELIAKDLKFKRLGKVKNDIGGYDHIMKPYAYGGNLQQQNNNNMLTEFNEGGSHEQNPNGGIPQGQSSNGQMNTVEQGETKKGNFVYSDRLYINEDLAKQMNLPGYIKGKSFAGASKAINDKFKDRNDIHTKATQKELLDRLAQSQEQLKAEQEAINQSMQINQSEVEYPEQSQMAFGGLFDSSPERQEMQSNRKYYKGLFNEGKITRDQFNGYKGELRNNFQSGISNGLLNSNSPFISTSKLGLENYNQRMNPNLFINKTQQFGGGGLFGQNFSTEDSALNTGVNPTDIQSKGPGFMDFIKNNPQAGNYVTGAAGVYDMGKEIFGKSNVSKDGNQLLSGANSGKSAMQGALKGAAAGASFGPLGTGIGAVAGGISGLVGGIKDQKNQTINNDLYNKKQNFYKYQFNENNDDTQVFAKGGSLDGGNPWDLPQSTMYDDPNYQNPLFKQPSIPEVNYNPGNIDYNTMQYKSPVGNQYGTYDNSNNFPNGIYQAPEITTSKAIDKTGEKIDYSKYKDAATNALRYAPVLGNILQKSKIGPAEVDSAIRNPYQYKKQYIDEAQYRNAADQQAALSMEALNKSGLSGNQLMAASLGTQLQRTKGVSEGAMAAKMHNLNENKIAEQVKQQNEGDYVLDSRLVRETNAQNRANRDTQMSKFDSEIANSLGAIGKEETFKKMAEKITGYDWMGKYLKANPNATPSEAIAAHDKEQENKDKDSKKYFENLPSFSDKIDYKTPGIVQNKKGGMMNLKFNKY